MLKAKYRYAVFTMLEELQKYSYKNRGILKDLQDVVYRVKSNYYEKKVKGNNQVRLMLMFKGT